VPADAVISPWIPAGSGAEKQDKCFYLPESLRSNYLFYNILRDKNILYEFKVKSSKCIVK
jgi:hypothetical protein